MGRVYGYVRVSRATQRIERQVENIYRVYPDAKLYKEVFTGRKIEGRQQFKNLLRIVKAGDTIVFDSVSRMSRNAEEGVALYFELYEKGIKLVFLNEAYINTEVYEKALQNHVQMTGDKVDLILEGVNAYLRELAKDQIRIAFEQSEKEVADLRKRTAEGIREARAKGKQIGQKQGAKLNVKKKEPAKREIKKYAKDFGGPLKDVEVMKLTGLARNTYYRYKKELLEELQEDNNTL